MRVLRLTQHTISAFGSTGVEMIPLPEGLEAKRTAVHVALVAAGGTIGEHPATHAQAFALISGDATVTGADGMLAVGAGDLVVWDAGEVHRTSANTDVIAVVIETDGVLGLSRHAGEDEAG